MFGTFRVLAIALLSACALTACNQNNQQQAAAPAAPAAPSPQGDTFDSIAQLPDLSGAWQVNASPDPTKSDVQIPFKPEYAAKLESARAAVKAGKEYPTGLNECEPNGMPTQMTMDGFYYQFLLTPGKLTVVPQDNQVRRIFTNKQAHPDDPDLTYGGDSIGHWEDGTLTVDTVGLLPQLPIVSGVTGTGDMHIVEKMHLTDDNTLQIDTTVTDSALSAPYSYTTTYTRHRDVVMPEILCVPGDTGPKRAN